MQNLITHIIKQEKELWQTYQFCVEKFGYDSRAAIQYQSKWHQCTELIEMFKLNTPTRKRNLSKFKHKKYTIIKTTCEL
jgi:hypothetical protein